MTWQGVPWYVGGGAHHSPEVARLLAHIASGGAEGVIGAGDLQVRALNVPGAGIRVMPGAGVLQSKFAGAGQQAYLVRNPDEDVVMVAPTGSSGGRTDLVAVIVEDPQYAGQPAPASIEDGPYVRTRVYTNVAAGVKTMTSEQAMALVAPGQTGYALAAYTLGVSDGTIEQADIVDLRGKPSPRTQVHTRMLNLPGSGVNTTLTSLAMTGFPTEAHWDIPVPSWAVKVALELQASGLEVVEDGALGGDWAGTARIALGALVTQESEVRPSPPHQVGGTDTFGYLCADELKVPAAMRGTTQTLAAQAKKVSSTGGITVRSTWGTTVVLRVTFTEDVDATFWEV